MAVEVKRILDSVADACARCGRDVRDVTVLAAVKTVPPERILELSGSGIDTIAENRVQEFVDKYPLLEGKFKQHFIGSLQTNKVKYLLGKVELIHSVDRIDLLREIEKRSAKAGFITDVLLEVNGGREPTKSGVYPEGVDVLGEAAADMPHVRVKGLMCVLPIGAPEALYAEMQELHADFNARYSAPILSMGMSNDYPTAIRYGATIIRLGRALFGERV